MRRFILSAASLAVAAGILLPVHAQAGSETACGTTPNPPNNCKTVTLDDSGKLTSPTTGGHVEFFGLGASTTYGVVDALQGLPPGSNTIVLGSYSLSWGTCSAGSATGASYSVGSGGSYPKTPSPTTPSPSGVTITTNASGNFACAYTLAYPSGSIPAGSVSVRNDFWVISAAGALVSQVASVSVPAGGGPFVPDVALAILIPLGLLIMIGSYMYLQHRRRPVTAS